MNAFEYCELWWSMGVPCLTFYSASRAETVQAIGNGRGSDRGYDTIESALDDLGRQGWELLSVPHRGTSLMFKRHLH